MNLIELMSKDLNIGSKFIHTISKRSERYYRPYQIPKARGGTRNIYHPSPVLKAFQYWLVENLFKLLPISVFATAYKKGSSIKKNAEMHLGNNHILRTDIENFFESITSRYVASILKNNKRKIERELNIILTQFDVALVMNLILLRGSLTIGSVSSPIISNNVMYLVDGDLANIAEKYNCVFTRYADDMIFSSEEFIDKNIIYEIEAVVNKIDLQLNNSKTYFISSKYKKMVTGVILNSGRLTIGRKKVDVIKKLIYDYCMHKTGDLNIIRGHLSYLKDIDPYSYGKLIIKYQRYGDINDLLIGKSLEDIQLSLRQAAATEK